MEINHRRRFIQQLGTIGGGSLVALSALSGESLPPTPVEAQKKPSLLKFNAPQAKDVEVFHYPLFSVENPVGPSELAIEAANRTPPLYHRYGLQDFLERDLKQQLASKMKVDPSLVFLKPGSTETLRMITRSLAAQKKPVLMSKHDYGFMYDFVKAYQASLGIIPMGKDLRVDLDRLANNSKKVSMIYLSNPHLPLNGLHSKSDLEALIKKSAPTPVIIDECYLNYLGADHEAHSCAPLTSQYPNVIVTRTFSKIYGLAALRIGYHAVSQELHSLLDLQSREMSPFSVAAAIGTLQDYQHTEKVLAHCATIRQKLVAFAEKHQIGYVKHSRTPFFTWIIPNLAANQKKKLLQRGVGFQPVSYGGTVPLSYAMVTLAREKEIDAYLYDFHQGLQTQ